MFTSVLPGKWYKIVHIFSAISGKYSERNLWFCISLLGLSEQNTTAWGLKIKDLFFSQFWSLEAHDQGIGRVGFFWGFPSWLADGYFLAMSSYGHPCVHVCLVSLRIYLNCFFLYWYQSKWMKAQHLVPQNVTVFGNKVFTDMIN